MPYFYRSQSVCQALLLNSVYLSLDFSLTFLRANASLNLENQIKKVDGLISGFEENLSQDGPILDVPNAVQARAENIQVRTSAFLHPFKV